MKWAVEKSYHFSPTLTFFFFAIRGIDYAVFDDMEEEEEEDFFKKYFLFKIYYNNFYK
jgi:hypothetical protein